MASTSSREARKCKTTRRSRFGCRNCKLRKVKCDENKPYCKRCSSFGVLCNFKPNLPDLQPIAADTGKQLLDRQESGLKTHVSSAVWISNEYASYELNAKCRNLMTRCFERSLFIADDPNTIYVNQNLLKLSFAYPFLMHAALAVAFTYDRHMNQSDSRRTMEECYHWSQSTTLLNRRLRDPIESKDKDPIWATAAALTILIFSSLDPCTPEQSWPLKNSGESDLDWLHMSNGKMSLWHVVNPLRPDSLFSVMTTAFAQMNAPFPEMGVGGISRALADLCLLGDSSTAGNNAYFCAAHALSQVLNVPEKEVSTSHTLMFILTINGSFENLLRQRDPVALLLLYLWYRKAGPSTWWIELRAKVECPSIYSYLRLHHRENFSLQEFLQEAF